MVLEKLRGSILCGSLTDEEVRQIADALRPLAVRSGEIVCKQENTGASMFLIAAGRVKVSIQRGHSEVVVNYLGPGEHFGELSMLTGAPRSATVAAVMDTELFELHRDVFHRLIETVPYLAVNLSQSLSLWLRGMVTGKKKRHVPAIVALAGSTPHARALVRPLAETLGQDGVRFRLLTDRPDDWPAQSGYSVHPLPCSQGDPNYACVLRAHVTQALGKRERILVDVVQERAELFKQCDEIWWLLEPADRDRALHRLERLLGVEPDLVARTEIVWVLHTGESLPLALPLKPGRTRFEFKVVLGGEGLPSPSQRRDVARLIHHMKRIRLGLALGGGGARGATHIGVLRALEKAGISVDMIAGTSAGSMVGLAYAYGMAPDRILEQLQQELGAGRFMRLLPASKRWYLWWLYRFGRWDRKFRKHYANCTLEQMLLPFYAVTVDLIAGKCIVRDHGDAVNAVLESINVPGVSRPILRDGAALVDGGVMNNVPADVLRERGADLVMAVDIGGKLAQRFGPNTAATPTPQMRAPGFLETMMRVIDVQQHGLMSARCHAADLVVSPDTSTFEFADLDRFAEMAALGEAAMEEALPTLKQMVARLETE